MLLCVALHAPLQDFKTGLLLRQSPKQQFIAQFIGIFVGIAVAIPTYILFTSTYVLGSDEMPAPAAFAWMKVAQVLNKGFSALPDRCWISMISMAALGVALPCSAAMLRRSSRMARFSAYVEPDDDSVMVSLSLIYSQVCAQRYQHRPRLHHLS